MELREHFKASHEMAFKIQFVENFIKTMKSVYLLAIDKQCVITLSHHRNQLIHNAARHAGKFVLSLLAQQRLLLLPAFIKAKY